MAGEAAMRLRDHARYHVCRRMSHKPELKPSQLPAVRGYGGQGLVSVRAEVARMQADAAPQPPSPASSGHLRSRRRPRLRRVRRRSGGKGLGRQGGRGGKEPRRGQQREGTGEDRQRRVEAGRRWWQQRLRGRGRGWGSRRW